MKKVSGKTHTQEQLNAWANQNNPNNKAYRAKSNNHSNQLNPNQRHISKSTTHKGVIKSWVMWNGHRITLSGTINKSAEMGDCLRTFPISRPG